MKKVIITSMILMMVSTSAWALTDVDGVKLNGKHYNLNIIGVRNPKKADMDSDTGTGGVVFVNLSGKSKIGLIKNTDAGLDADDYAVLDKNGTDGDGALVALPDPGLDPYIVGDKGDADTMSDYSVFVRPLGKPLGWAKITTCAEIVDSELLDFLDKDAVEVLNDEAFFGGVASIESVGQDITFRNKGKTSITNVTAELLTIVLKVAILDEFGEVIETIYVRVPIFDDILQGEYWEYDNTGLKLLQVRFYPMETDVSEGDGDLVD
jgi:hypothetical protein